MYRMSWNGKPMASETSSTISKLLCCSRSLRRKYVHLWWTTLSWHGKNCVTSTEKRKYQRRDWRRISYSNSMCNGFCLFLSCVLVFNSFFSHHFACITYCVQCDLHFICMSLAFPFTSEQVLHIGMIDLYDYNGLYTIPLANLWKRKGNQKNQKRQKSVEKLCSRTNDSPFIVEPNYILGLIWCRSTNCVSSRVEILI